DTNIPTAFSPNNPLINVNANTGIPGPLGGTIINPIIVQKGYINASNDTFIGIVVQSDCNDVSVRGGINTAPDYSVLSAGGGAIGFRSTASRTIVHGFRSTGNVASGRYNLEGQVDTIFTDCIGTHNP